MDTLEQRVGRLERSCRRWRLGFLMISVMGVAGMAAQPSLPVDAKFAHLTVQSLTIRTQPDGAFISASCDKDVSSIKLASPSAATVVALFAQKDSANLFVSRNTAKGLSSSGLGADDESGFVDLRTADGKNKEIEPE
jgi:hypothetical protein